MAWSLGDRMGRSRDDIEASLAGFVAEELAEEGAGEEDPLATDALDSLGLEQLVEYIEEEFGITIKGEEMVKANFKSVPVLAAFVEAKLAEAKA